jgi:hypothetical protein
MSANLPRAILLIVLGLAIGPGYYAYAKWFSGRLERSYILDERAERWVLPDGSIQRTRSGLAFKPLALSLHPDMNKVQLRFAFHAAAGAGTAAGTNEYAVSLAFMRYPVAERMLRVELRPGETARVALQPLEVTAPGEHAFMLQEVGQPAVAVDKVELEVWRNVETPRSVVFALGMSLAAAGVAWIAYQAIAKRL